MEDEEIITPRGPSEAAWQHYKKTIIDLYRNRKLKDVMREMEQRYKFVSTKRMYDTRFRKWEISKILKRDEKRRIAEGIADQYQAGESNVTTKVSNKDLMKTMRWISSQCGSSYGVERVTGRRWQIKSSRIPSQSSSGEQTSLRKASPGHSQGHEILSPNSIGRLDSMLVSLTTESIPEDVPSIKSSPELTPAHITPEKNESSPDATMGIIQYPTTPSPSPSLVTSETRVQDLIFQNVQVYALSQLTNEDATSVPGDVLTYGSSPNTELFWGNIKNGIYLSKIASKFPESRFRISTAFGEARSLLPLVCSNGVSLEFLRNILATLSPTNTTIDPTLRYSLLSGIANEVASSSLLGPLHPITVICDALQNDGGISLISSLALHVMLDAIRDTLGPSHPAYYKLMKTIIAMTRRDGDLDTARQMAEGAMNVARSTCGEYSEQARAAEVELAHILTKLGKHGKAISMRMKAISLPQEQSRISTRAINDASVQLYCNDTLAMHTMEDIAEYYVRFGHLPEALAWLKRAKTSAENISGKTTCTAEEHIADKLETLMQGKLQGQVIDL